MVKLAANLSMMFNEVPFLDRFAEAAACGFKAVEYLFPYDFTPEQVAEKLNAAGLQQALFNLPPGDWEKGERGLSSLPSREEEFMASLEKALTYAKALKCPRLHVMAGMRQHGANTETYVANLKKAAKRAAQDGVNLCIEPINQRDIPGFFLATTGQAVDVIEAVDEPNIGLQLDLYHLQISEGDLAMRTRALLDRVEHIQIAGNPDRHEPDIGEVYYPFLFDLLDELGYQGWIGCEYRPKAETKAGLSWAADYGVSV